MTCESPRRGVAVYFEVRAVECGALVAPNRRTAVHQALVWTATFGSGEAVEDCPDTPPNRRDQRHLHLCARLKTAGFITALFANREPRTANREPQATDNSNKVQ